MPGQYDSLKLDARPHSTTQPVCSLLELTAHSSEAIIAAARELLLEYGQFVAAQKGVATFCYGALKQEAADLPHSYLDQSGGAILATVPVAVRAPIQVQVQDQVQGRTQVQERPAGFVAWRSLPNPMNAWELKRLWTRPEARGLQIGRALVQAVIARARATGKTAIYLDTAPDAMCAAHQLYLQMGFEECPCYNGRAQNGILYMRKCL